MARKTEWFLTTGVRILANLPDNTFFDTSKDGLEFQAPTQLQLHEITQAFPGCIWKKAWRKELSWWEYTTVFEGVPLRVYAVKENPPACTAIIETRKVEEQVPIQFETRLVEKQVIVGWDCPQEVMG